MTGSLVLDLLISLAGVGVLVAVSFFLGGWKSARVDEAAARERLAFDEPDFVPGDWLIGADGKGAAVLSADGREAAFVFALGDGLATRRMARASARASSDGSSLRIILRDPSKWVLTIGAPSGEIAARWAGRLSNEDYIGADGHALS